MNGPRDRRPFCRTTSSGAESQRDGRSGEAVEFVEELLKAGPIPEREDVARALNAAYIDLGRDEEAAVRKAIGFDG